MAWFRYERIPAEDIRAGDAIALKRTQNFYVVSTVELGERVGSFTFEGRAVVSLLRATRVWRMVEEAGTHAYDLACPRCGVAVDSHCVEPEGGTIALKGLHRQRVEAVMVIERAKSRLTGLGAESV